MEWGFVLGLFSLTLVLIPSRDMEIMVGLFCPVVTPPCGYCLKVSMTVRRARPVVSRLRGNDGPGIYIIGTMLGHH